ncbi:MAG: TonB-dependent receptor [Hydrococcus sp. RU_2_2]|nr:TonB-dependent receptor [Hydrococcus sp. RU_2_2]
MLFATSIISALISPGTWAQEILRKSSLHRIESSLFSLSPILGEKRTERERNAFKLAQSPEVITIAGVRVNPTENGIEVVLETTRGEQLQVSDRTSGKSFIAEIANAQLQLPDGKPFRIKKPAAGIVEAIVTNKDEKTIQLTITGETAVPQVELFDSDEGIIFGFTPPPPSLDRAESTTSSFSPPLVRGETEGGQIIPVTGVQLNPTETGIELLLQTPPQSAEQLQTNNISSDNNFIADIPNAQLQLPDNKPFRSQNPVEGIREVTVNNQTASTIRVTASGETAIPQVELFDSDEGLIFGLTPVNANAQTPSTPQPEGGQIATIDRVQLNPTETGFEIILLTPTGVAQQLRVVNISQGNNFIAEVPNAQLQQPFRQEKPIEGVSEVTVTNRDENTVLVTVVGEEKQPTVELFDSEEGLIFSLVPPPFARGEQGGSQQGNEGGQTAQEEDIELIVTGEQDGYLVPSSTIGTRTDTPLRDVPQSIQVVPRQVLEDQGLTQISDALRNVSGVTPRKTYSNSGFIYDIRGFEAARTLRNGFDIQLGRGTPTTVTLPNTIERVEVLKGPASVLYGVFEPGGVVNLVTKQPLSDPYYEAEFTAGQFSFYQPSVDLTGPLTSDGRLLYRLTAAYQNSGSFVAFVNSEAISISPVLRDDFSDATSLTLAYEYSYSDQVFYEGLPANPVLFDLPINRFLNDPDGRIDNTTHTINLTFDHEFNDNLNLRSAFGSYFSRGKLAAYRIADFDYENNSASQFYRDQFTSSDYYSWQNDLTVKFNTGSIQHQLLLGLELTYRHLEYRPTSDSELIPTGIDFFNPVYYEGTIPPVEIIDPFSSSTTTVGIYLQDLVALLPNLKLLIGGRYDFVSERANSTFQFIPDPSQNFDSADEFKNEAFSPRVGIVYQPIEPISLYASFSRSFVPNIR